MDTFFTMEEFQSLSYEKLKTDPRSQNIGKITTNQDWVKLQKVKTEKFCHIVEVTVSEGIEANRCDVLDLQMFFLNVCRLQRYPNMDQHYFVLAVCAQNDNEYYRIKAYLYAQVQNQKKIRVFLQNITRSAKWESYGGRRSTLAPTSLGRIIPLIKVTMDADETEPAASLNDLISEEHCLDSNSLRMVSEKITEKSKESFHWTFGMSSQFEVLKFCRERLLHTLFESITGTREKMIREDQKSDLRKQLSDALAKHSQGLTFLGQFFWLYLLRYICEQKDLFSLSVETGSYILRRDILIKALNDATAYAECVCQLLENSCQHTEHKVAFLSMRVYNTDLTAPPSSLEKITITRLRLSRRFQMKSPEEDANMFNLNKDVSHYLEIRIFDDAHWQKYGRSRGILECFQENSLTEKNSDAASVNTLDKLFKYISSRADSVANHYGLRLFEKLVQTHHGCFLVSTPDIQSEGTIDHRKYFIAEGKSCEITASEKDVGDGLRSTEYDILLPVSYNQEKPESPIVNKGEIFDLNYFKEKERYDCISFTFGFVDDVFKVDKSDLLLNAVKTRPYSGAALTAGAKHDWVVQIEDALSKAFCQDGYTVSVVDLRGQNRISIELFAKGLFLYLAKHQEKNKRPLFALLFSHHIAMQEFIRIFSIFYGPDGTQTYMGEAQIALCSTMEDSGFPAVRCLLQGTNISTAYRSSVVFSYYDPMQSIELLPQLRYLAHSSSDGDVPPQFPFDLCIPPSIFADWSKEEVANEFDCWFTRWLKNVLELERDEASAGCKISNAHVRLTSKVHVKDFYEAETLFHNSGITYRMACLLAGNILPHLKNLNSPWRNLSIVGYEAYSTLLVKEIARILKLLQDDTSTVKTYDGIYTAEGKDPEVHFFSQTPPIDSPKEKTGFILVYPIGTTLTTLYRMADVLLARFKLPRFCYQSILASYVVTLVADQKKDPGKNSPATEYWNFSDENGIVILQPIASVQNSDNFSAHYMVVLRSEWHQPGEGADYCTDKQRELCVSYVDKTSTLPVYIFPKKGRGISGNRALCEKVASEDMDTALDALNGCVSYGHIQADHNHYCYYIHFDKYFPKIQNQLEARLDSLKTTIREDAFNLVISPLSEQESPFLKLILDKVFRTYAHLIHIPIQTIYKESLRTQYSYITDSYRELRALSPNTPVNIYYVSNSITTGSTVQRAKKLISLLLKTEYTKENRPLMFDGVFTLVNRCSVDTINTFVRFAEKDFFAFLHLDIPHFNLVDQKCPLCKLSERYQIMAEETVTNTLAQEFILLADKFLPVTPEAHAQWQTDQVLNAPSYFSWLCQWVYFRRAQKDYIGLEDAEDIGKRLDELSYALCSEISAKITKRNPNGQEPQTDLRILEQLNIRQFSKQLQEDALYLFNKLILPEKNDRRLKAAHMVHYLFDQDDICEPDRRRDNETYLEQKIGIARKLIEKKICEVIENEKAIDRRVEWLLTLLKAFSREHIANFYFVRQAAFSIMQDLLDNLLHNSTDGAQADPLQKELAEHLFGAKDTSHVVKIFCNGYPGLEYRIYTMLMECLADMQSIYILRKENIEKILFWYEQLQIEQETAKDRKGNLYHLLNFLPSKEKLMSDCNKYMKWSTMVGDEDQRYFVLNDLLLHETGNVGEEK